MIDLDALAPIETFDAHGWRWAIRQLVTGGLQSSAVRCGGSGREIVVETWPVGFSVRDVRQAIETHRQS